MNRSTQIFALVLVLLTGANEQLAGQQLFRDEYNIRAFEALEKTTDGLSGEIDGERQRIDLIVAHMAQDEAKYDELMRLLGITTELVGESNRTNQKEAFFDLFTFLACQQYQMCALREEMEQLKKEFARQKDLSNPNSNLMPEPAPELAPEFAPPPPLYAPTPAPDYAPIPPSHTPVPMPTQPTVWLGPVHRITSIYDLSPYAQLVARCVNLDAADGIPCHGDMYREPNGQNVLVTHRLRVWNRSVLAVR